ncbi:Hypothetical protein AKI40_4008 [Enterobacter sp. FY-07]|nr:Hypothetical protein AKI40_4008 [Enterobacter sp. FY-07]
MNSISSTFVKKASERIVSYISLKLSKITSYKIKLDYLTDKIIPNLFLVDMAIVNNRTKKHLIILYLKFSVKHRKKIVRFGIEQFPGKGSAKANSKLVTLH